MKTTYDTLLAQLTTLKVALETEDYDQAAELVAQHGQELREFMELPENQANIESLRPLWNQQQELLEVMKTKHAVLGKWLRKSNRSKKAHKVYQQQEGLGA